MSEESERSWAKLDRKATAIAEFTLRQYRTRLSTWVVLSVSVGAMMLLNLFYLDFMTTELRMNDNDGDSYDYDGDGYPTGQEILLGTDPFNELSYPSGVTPDPPSKYINEDDFDWDNITKDSFQSIGYDDDGDCVRDGQLVTDSQKDNNGNLIPCDIAVYYSNFSQVYIISTDGNVDEDPNEDKFGKEAIHRAYILSVGKMGIVYLLGIFLPLFLASGLIRNEMNEGTMHFMLAKPISRGEVLLYRMLGYLGIVWPFIIALCALMALITGFLGPGEGLFRFSDLGVWVSICFAAMLVSMVYGMIFCVFGILWKQGMVLAIILAAWELGMAFVSVLAGGDTYIQWFSVIGWGLMIVDIGAALNWQDLPILIEMGNWHGGNPSENSGCYYQFNEAYDICDSEELPGTEPLEFFASTHGLGVGNWLAAIIASSVLLIQAFLAWVIGQAIFKSKEMEV
ncbi:MAG: hypothetical protein CMA25_07395 [Euryarchaeota archaeon]|nr:hypothetical protein [Euryarchaeota archaeon]